MEKKVFDLDELIKKKIKKVNIYNDYTHIRCYHGCRPTSIEDYYKQGIKPIEKISAKAEAIQRLCDSNISEEKVSIVFEKHWEEFADCHKSVWCGYSKDELLNESGHYVVYGSEFINEVAVELGCRENLKHIGIPTIFECEVPLNKIPDNYLKGINGLLEQKNNTTQLRVIGSVLPKEIVSHFNPEKMFDPYPRITYTYRNKDK